MTAFNTLDRLDPKGKRVLVRGDLNVPVKDGKVTDASRIERIAPTVRELSSKGARVVLLSHFERPKGKRVPELSLRRILPAVEKALGREVAFADDCIGPAAESAVAALQDGAVLLLENLRYHDGEEANDGAFAQALAKLGDAYVNDGFSVSHRAHASVEALARLLPAYAGRGMEAELNALTSVLVNPARPVCAVVGGAKVSTKFDLLIHLTGKVDSLVIGGAMANTLLLALGRPIGKSLAERDMADTALKILDEAKARGCAIVLPEDVVAAKELKANVSARTVPVDAVASDDMILDIGSETLGAIGIALEGAKTVVWNGPLGAFETPPFDLGTTNVARHIAMLTKAGRLTSVAGGGETLAALHAAGVAEDFSYVSAAGGAFLEWMEGKELPGVTALEAAAKRQGGSFS